MGALGRWSLRPDLLGECHLIFLTLGTQLPFDRLVQALDDVAMNLDEKIFGQIGKGNYIPQNFEHTESLSPVDFQAKIETARVVVGHAGIGTILSGLATGTPLILMARRASLGEHRNEHQTATINQIKKIAGVHVADNREQLEALLKQPSLAAATPEVSKTQKSLIENLRHEIFGKHPA